MIYDINAIYSIYASMQSLRREQRATIDLSKVYTIFWDILNILCFTYAEFCLSIYIKILKTVIYYDKKESNVEI